MHVMRTLLILALCSSCTFAHGLAHRNDAREPTAQLSPKMVKLDREQRSAPWWTFTGDQALMIGGFMAGPIVDGRVPSSAVEPINIAGLAVSALVMASLGYTAFKWDTP
jgi:hypothetical protein